MRATIQQTFLNSCLSTVARSAGNRSTLPVLSNVHLQTQKDRLIFSCTNLEVGVVKSAPATIQEEGSLTVPVKNLLEASAALPAVDVNIDSVGEVLKLSTPNFKASFNGISSEEFPSIPFSSNASVELDCSLLLDSLPQITFSAAVDEGRPVLTGILTKLSTDKLELVATDGFRLSHKIIPLKSKNELQSLIPRRTFEEVSRLLSEQKQDEKLSISPSENQNQIIFTLGDTKLSSRLIEGIFPSWEKIIPQTFIAKATVDKSQLLAAIKLASVFAKDNANIIKFEVLKGSIKVLSEAKELGSQETDVDSQTSGESLTIAYNSRFLTECLTQSPGDSVELQFSGALSPTLVKPTGEELLEYVIMPIRLS